jgi:lipid A 3-O-deacylase
MISRMKFALAVLLLASAKVALAQDISSAGLPARSITKGAWDFGLLGGGGTGLGYAKQVQFLYAGGRIGRILTKDHGTGLRRGNFEWAVEMLPVYTVLMPTGTVYGGSFKPSVWRWNFTSGKTVAPYISIAGGILFSTRNLPSGNTSWVNFTPEAALGANIFLKRRKALQIEAAYVHHSNAGLSTYNPGYNASLFFTVGFSWFKPKE